MPANFTKQEILQTLPLEVRMAGVLQIFGYGYPDRDMAVDILMRAFTADEIEHIIHCSRAFASGVESLVEEEDKGD